MAASRPPATCGRVLEIGCGTGMVLFRLAASCESYVGIDFSASALQYIRSKLDPQVVAKVTLEQFAADEVHRLAGRGPFDVVIINSVIQYFPDAGYLERVLKSAHALLAPHGFIFIGDVRSLLHLKPFHTAVEIARCDGSTTLEEVRARVQQRASQETELVVHPAYFESIAQELSDMVCERAELKAGIARNEMTAFRYDVVLRKMQGQSVVETSIPETVSCTAPCSVESLRKLLAAEPAVLHVRGIRNARVAREVGLVQQVAEAEPGLTVAELKSDEERGLAALDPDDIRDVDRKYEAIVEFSPDEPALIDVTFRHLSKTSGVRINRGADGIVSRAAYTNVPAGRGLNSNARLVAELRERLRQQVPEYMIPSAFVPIETLPLTPNGKIDRKALPVPNFGKSTGAARRPPGNDLERGIVDVLQELLGGREVGADDHFLDVGVNSLLMVQASIRLRSVLGRPVPLVKMFQYPTARALAAALENATPPAATVKRQGEDRARTRREAIQRLRDGGRAHR